MLFVSFSRAKVNQCFYALQGQAFGLLKKFHPLLADRIFQSKPCFSETLTFLTHETKHSILRPLNE
ncbi:hypothetical protein SAMN05660206_102380 [Sphingobacterium wenxiniae]|uniref:Uncharacterized protein n=1 Tax=Sphingobacterium wenxiniae TaxID=683125 RepID=A0A1I6QJZ9_9SPHI|nr:hypothetical protein SAMN05660206_102380 [Sphingobacterium wenxiniae]